MLDFTRGEWIAIAAVAVPALLWALDKYFGIIRALWNWNKMPEKIEVKVEADTIPDGTDGKVVLTIEGYEKQVRQRIAAAIEQHDKAEGPERERLGTQITELESRLQNIESKYKAAQTLIWELENLIEREGKQLGHEKVERAERALAAGDFDEADELLAEISAEEDLAVQRKARAEYGRGQIAEEQVRLQDAATHFARAAELDPKVIFLAKAAEASWYIGNVAHADRLNDNAIALARDEFGEQSMEFAEALNGKALTLKARGDFAGAEQLYRQSIDIVKEKLGGENPEYGLRLGNLANLLDDQRRHHEALPLREEEYRVMNTAFDGPHPFAAKSASNFGNTLQYLRRFHEAEDLYRKAIEIDKLTIGEAHPEHARHLCNLGNLLQVTDRYVDAEENYNAAEDIIVEKLGERHIQYSFWLNSVAALKKKQGCYTQARSLHTKRHGVDVVERGLTHPHTRFCAANYASLLRAHFPDDPALAELVAAFGPDIGT